MNIPGFLVKGVLGKGAMATVYLARENSLARDVALKVIRLTPEMDYKAVRRFLRECQILANLKHPNIVTLYQLKQEKDSIHMAMEFMPVGSLKERIAQGLPQHASLKIVQQIAGALEVAHNKGIVHRDIKPSNILFMDKETPVLTDFGIAMDPQYKANLTAEGATIGTPNYMSPEQAQGGQIDGRSDLYSLGIILFEMLTGERPFQAKNAIQLAMMHVQGPIPKLPAQQARLQPLVDQLLAKNPTHRFQSAAALCQALTVLDLPMEDHLLANLRQIGEVGSKGGDALIQTFLELTPADQAVGMDLLLDEVQRYFQENQNYSLSLLHTNCLRSIQSQKEKNSRQRDNIGAHRQRVRLQSLWLELQNQEQIFVADQASVAKTITSVGALCHHPEGWEDWRLSTRFYNLLAMNYLTILAFEKANRLLKKYVDYFRKNCEDTPLGPMRSRWIGALFSTFAQTLALSAHATHFRKADRKRVGVLTGGALKYSEKALQHFEVGQDRTQQRTDQAQVYLQYFLLANQPHSLRMAEKSLRTEPTPQQAVALFLAEFPQWQTIATAHRVAALLKLAWLSGERPDWLIILQKVLIPRLFECTPIHPHQQILGYLLLLEENPQIRYSLADRLTKLRWKNLSAVNAMLFIAQTEYAEKGLVSKKSGLSICGKLASLAKNQSAGGPNTYDYIRRECEHFQTLEQGHSSGPLVLLPFYYC